MELSRKTKHFLAQFSYFCSHEKTRDDSDVVAVGHAVGLRDLMQ